MVTQQHKTSLWKHYIIHNTLCFLRSVTKHAAMQTTYHVNIAVLLGNKTNLVAMEAEDIALQSKKNMVLPWKHTT